jgi:hypothetical protein
MDLWRYTFAELTGGIQPTGDSMAMPVPMEFGEVTPFEFDPRYGTASIVGGSGLGDQALVRHGQDCEWDCIGWYVGDTMTVWEDGRNGLGTQLFLRCMAHRSDIPITKKLTERGSRLVRRAHKLSVEGALANGQNVRPEVLEDYGLTPTDAAPSDGEGSCNC